MAKYELKYFNLKARAELCRVTLVAAGQEFKDTRYEFEDWPKYKESIPGKVLPVLEIGGEVTITQSKAIARYLAREFGFYGKTTLEKARVDETVDCLQDVIGDLVNIRYAPEVAKEEAKKRYQKTCARILPFLEERLVGNNGGDGFFVGDTLTIADLYTFVALESPIQDNPQLLKDCPKMAALRERVAAQAKIAEYLKNRPVTDY